jgi:hypothetical protein
MEKEIISSFKQFKEVFKDKIDFNADRERIEALKDYFAFGGFISVSKTENGWPKLLYPSPLRLQQLIKDLSAEKELLLKKQRDWKQQRAKAKFYRLVNNVKKFKEPLYWKHLAKLIYDLDYRNDAKTVKLPAELVADKRWKPMINMFVNNFEYRKQLTETFENSIVYEKDRELAKYAHQLQEFRREISEKKIEFLQKKIDETNKQIKVYQTILKWANLR